MSLQLTLAQVMGPNMQRQKLLAVQTILNFLRIGDDQTLLRGLDPETKILFSHAAVVWIFVHIVQRGVIPQDAMMSIVQIFPKELIAIGQAYEDAGIMEGHGKTENDTNLPVKIIAIADRRFVSISGLIGCFDLNDCRVLSKSPLTFEGISYNLTAPVLVECQRIHKEAKDGPQPKNADRTFRANNARHRTLNTGGGSIGPGSSAVGPQHCQNGTGRDKRR